MLAIFSGPLLVYYPHVENFAVFGALGAGAIASAIRAAQPGSAAGWLVASGALTGGATLARIDGVLLVVAPATAWLIRSEFRRPAGWAIGVASAAAFALVLAPWLARNLAVLKAGGWLLLVGLLEGQGAELDLRQVLMRRLQLKGMALRPLPLEAKVAVARRFRERWLPELAAGRVRPIIDSTFPLERVRDAHRRMESNATFGKVVLEL